MHETLLIISIVLSAVCLALSALLFRRVRATDLTPVITCVEGLEKCHERTDRAIKDEMARNRQESAEQGRALREEVQSALRHSTDSLVQSLDRISAAQQQRLEDFAAQLGALKLASDASSAQLRLELTNAFSGFQQAQEARLVESSTLLQNGFESFARQLSKFSQLQQEQAQTNRNELSAAIERLTQSNEKKSEELRATVDAKLKDLQADNSAKLEEMRRTVDDKLQGALEKRLGDSFKLVSDRLEQVHKGLGEMQSLASGVGDLKRVLTNVKARGTWGEIQLGNLLEQVLTQEQFDRNVPTKPGGRELVEFAIKLPGRDEDHRSHVWLPIDAKFPKEDYERLVDAAERGDAGAVDQAGKDLEQRVRGQARSIRDKYINPPATTDFGVLYLPTEGLYAEVLRRPGLCDGIQREYRVVVVGPTTLAAFLNSLQMGFRTLAIQQRSSEVWNILGAVKSEFGKFGEILDKVKRKLDETGRTIDEAAHRSRQVEKKLKSVEALPSNDAAKILEFSSDLPPDPEPTLALGEDDAVAPAG